MARMCELTGKKPLVGMNVSHSHIRTKRRYLPNLQNVSFWSDVLGRSVTLKVSTAALRTVDHNDGLDNFLLTTPATKLAPKAAKLKKQIEAKHADIAAA
ncbi:50S ribosomal protein L28 [Rhodothalassium salexigens]|uniref:50S ribosomal protein L28 n=1 Tax=Rhodothalassium salexigens TaxID=1086 RepID=UPI001914D32A|nr:50S ribosomal protein L28 [Rhodothalassium salexigens]MBK5920856.1 50S ribosomal protein L28 [Rhodothalassium salexigens]